ncbi:AP-4 complex subunit mu [Plasmodium brasilianum]|uniref:AP-4 complex subunit mu, putative n=2 Tax=Plasmodium (Plasmodium) TaxID=418103 RepID=A0A1A8W1A7_PLAMA|nr:AP-4 complex subunit mu, putative [Plasmodium malariae]KAI4838322.1 AP-4 complex subunit mu [Plasmodium brasilianum]SBS85432.1 AP-4 complex subunit mu, putative [Plasmodium malariae]SCN12715.1 AP-4 complex subunit mu, putative [Plasmodium malariae]
MVVSQLYILSPRGDTIISRDFRGDISKGSAELFFRNVKLHKGDAPPLFYLNGINFIYLKSNSLYFVLTSLFNVSPSYLVELLNRLLKVFKDFCGQINEEIIRANFILIYEIIDEVIDYGYIQNSNTEYIRNLIHNEIAASSRSSNNNNMNKKFAHLSNFSIKHSNTLPSNASQKPIQINDKKNEIFIDIVEKINLIMNSKGEIIYSYVDGVIQIKSYLLGNPYIKIALNDDLYIKNIHNDNSNNIIIDDCNFNHLVNLSQFEREKILSLYQPDGECVLMNYRINNNFKAPFRVFASLVYNPTHTVELCIRIRLDIPAQYTCTNVFVNCNLCKHISNVHLDLNSNSDLFSAHYISNEHKLLWTIKKFKGENEYSIRSKITLNTNYVYSRRDFGPIYILFEIPMFNLSKLRIKYLRIIENYKSCNTHRWVRYITQSSSYVYRLN